MVKFFAQQSKGSLILKPVSRGFVLCRIKSEQEPLAGNTKRFSSIVATPLCLPTEKLGQRWTKQKGVLKTNRWIRQKKSMKWNYMFSCLREAVNGGESKSKAILFGLQNLDQDSRLPPIYFHSDDRKHLRQRAGWEKQCFGFFTCSL